MNLHEYEYEYRIFSWIISVDISMLLKIYGYEYAYAKFSWILSMGSPIHRSAEIAEIAAVVFD